MMQGTLAHISVDYDNFPFSTMLVNFIKELLQCLMLSTQFFQILICNLCYFPMSHTPVLLIPLYMSYCYNFYKHLVKNSKTKTDILRREDRTNCKRDL